MILLVKTSILAILGHFWPVFGLLWPWYQCLKLSMSIFVLFLTGLSEISKKFWITTIYLMKLLILAILSHFWPVFGLIWPPYLCPKLLMSIFDLLLTGLSEISEKILNNNDLFDEIADFGHFRLFLAYFWPVMTPVPVLKAFNEYIFPSSDFIESDCQEIMI